FKLNGETLVSSAPRARETAAPAAAGNFVLSALVTPGRDIPLPPQSPRGVSHNDQNFLVFPPHGNQWGPEHSGAGLSIGRNGVAVFEHWNNNIAPVLVWQAPSPLDRPTHVALAYAAGVPALFIDGRKVHTGVASGQTPNPTSGKAEAFSGTCSGAVDLSGPLTDKDLAALSVRAYAEAKAASQPFAALVYEADLADLRLEADTAGRYEATMADGSTRFWNLTDTPQCRILDKTAWQVTFRPPAGAEFTVTFQMLQDWKDSADPRVKYFSGTAVYAGHFDWPKPRTSSHLWLDLGEVHNIAAVRLNGVELGTVWTKPYRVDITDALKAGANLLEIRIANNWLNRLIGDEQYPDDTVSDKGGYLESWPEWVFANTPRPEARRSTLASRKQAKKDDPLHSSGLLGPITIKEKIICTRP
ncbi:MAG: hypothetical protein PHU80_04320, partial [Kiritimatiellae bacterium]|nr:hypothetical protein [Kiritimatiellia bacterium]